MAEKHLEDHERAHTGKTGAKVRHGQDAVGKKPGGYQQMSSNTVYQKLNFGKDLD